jgi:probable F420-dependent oxidoreductase
VRFATNILLAALRRPVVLAKVAATIDVLSGGRLDLGVGVGWQKEEYDAAGLAYEHRGALLNQTLEVVQALWREQAASYQGEGLSFTNIHQMPKPVQEGGVPIWVSGTVNQRAMDRLARYGSGWIPWGDDAADLKAGIERMRRAVADRGRDPSTLGVVGTLRTVRHEDRSLDVARTMAGVPELVAAGVTDVALGVSAPEEYEAAVEYLTPIVAAFRDVTR